jgi:hypothetical protein
MSGNSKWYEPETDREFAAFGVKLSVLVAGVLILLMLVSGGITIAKRIWWSPVEGQIQQHEQNVSNANRTAQQQNFETLFADAQGYNVKIADAAVELQTSTDSSDMARLRQNLSGLQRVCVDTVQQYNAATHTILAQDWKDPRLPYALDSNEFCSTSKSSTTSRP